MRFSALLCKELRECLPWMLLAAIVVFAFGGFSLRAEASFGDRYWRYSRLSPGSTVNPYDLTCYSTLQIAGPWLLFSSIGLGLILGVRHFWIPHFTRTWPFLLHRSVSRRTILGAKLTAALITCVVSMGLVWIALFWYASRPEVFAVPQTLRIFVEGWIFVMLGVVVYLGTSLSALSTANWYTTKIFGLLFAMVIFVTIMSMSTFWAIGVIAVSTAILLVQIFDTFLRREF